MPSINVVRLDENPHETVNGIRDDTNSRGVDLDGATITATYADGSTEILTWQAFDSYTYGGATGTDIAMSFGYDWHELSTTKPLTSLQIDLQPASSVFDTTLDVTSRVIIRLLREQLGPFAMPVLQCIGGRSAFEH